MTGAPPTMPDCQKPLPGAPGIGFSDLLDGQFVTIKNGDCRTVLKELAPESIQCCVTSPPYFGLRDYGCAGQIGLETNPAEYVSQIVAAFAEVWRVLRADGTLWLNLGDSYANDGKWGGHTGGKHVKALHCSPIGRNKKYTGLKPKDLIGIPWMVAFALRNAGWYLRSDIIWHKPNPMPESVTDRCTKSHEYIFLLTKSPLYYYDAEAIKEPSVCDRVRGTHRWSQVPGDGDNSGLSRRDTEPFRNKRSVWEVTTMGYAESHFATFPPDLIKPCILAGTKPGDVVLDPFGGSGTTGMVALELGRRAILVELNPAYAKLCDERCTTTRGLPLAV